MLIVVAVFVEQSDSLAIATLCIAEFLFCPVQVAQVQQQHTFLNATSSGFLVAFFVGSNGIGSVALGEINISYGIIHLVEVFLVVVRSSHSLQLANHLLGTPNGHHLGHSNSGIELQLIRWIQAYNVFKSLVSQLAVAKSCFELSHQKPLAGFLLATHFVFDNLSQVGYGLLVAFQMNVIIGVSVVPFLYGTPVERIAAHLGYHVLSVIHPVLFNVALGQPSASLTVDGRLGGIKTAHVGKS